MFLAGAFTCCCYNDTKMILSVGFNMYRWLLLVDKCVCVSLCFLNFSEILHDDFAAICWIMPIKCACFVVVRGILQ